MAKKYAELSNRQQINLVRKKALLAAKAFGFSVQSLKCINHGYNTTFKLVSGGKTYALRLGVSTPRSLANVKAEHQWMKLLSKQGFRVPNLIAKKSSNETLVVLPKDEMFAAIPVTLMAWVPGSPLGDQSVRTKTRMMEKLGQQTAFLHLQARKVKFSKGAKLETLDGVFWSRPNRVKDFHKTLPKIISQKKQAQINQLQKDSSRLVAKYWRTDKKIPIHGDLHVWNINATRSEIYILDFDDCGLSIPVWDIAVTLYYHATDKNFEDLIKSYIRGYRKVAPLPIKRSDDLRQFLIGRALLLMNEVVGMTAANISKKLPSIFERIEKRIGIIQKTDFAKILEQ